MSSEIYALKEINKANANFPYNEYISEWKKEGKKVVGWNCCSALVPEEVIHAAGILPIWVTGDSKELALDNAISILPITPALFPATLWNRL